MLLCLHLQACALTSRLCRSACDAPAGCSMASTRSVRQQQMLSRCAADSVLTRETHN